MPPSVVDFRAVLHLSQVPKHKTSAAFEALATFRVTLFRDGTQIDTGRGSNVLDGPLSALRHLVELLASDPFNPQLSAGEIVTTGTLTRAFPVVAGETWSTAPGDIPLEGISITFR